MLKNFSEKKLLWIAAGLLIFTSVLMVTRVLTPNQSMLVVKAPIEYGVVISVDGEIVKELAPAELMRLWISAGSHVVRFAPYGQGAEGKPSFERTVDMSKAKHRYLISSQSEQCFVQIEMTDYAYSPSRIKTGASPSQRATVTKRVSFDDVHAMPRLSAFSIDALPDRIDETDQAYLYVDGPCSLLKTLSDEKVLRFLDLHAKL